MAKQTWLRKVKRIYDLGAWNMSPRDMDRDEEFDVGLNRKLPKLCAHHQNGMPVGEQFREHFHCGHHDDFIVGHHRDHDYHLFLGCAWANDLQRQIREALEVKVPQSVFTVEIVCHDAQYVRWAESDRDGNLRFWRPDWEGAQKLEFATLARDWFFSEDGQVQWVVHVHNLFSRKGGGDCFGMIDCERLTVVDHRERLLVETWGDAIVPYWRALMALPLHDRYRDHIDLPDIPFAELCPTEPTTPQKK